ncbi:MAG: MMPL family transporter, partial [Methanogenium sp.]|nr:MMPL family transporter [Methanogenium sp.]
MERIYENIAGVIIRRPRGVIVAMILCFLVCAFFSTTIYHQSISEEYIDMNAFDGILYTDYNERLATDKFILVIQSSDPTSYQLLSDLLFLGDEFSQIEYVSGTVSLASVVQKVGGGVIPHNQEEINRIVSALPAEYRDQLLPDNDMSLAMVTIDQGVPADRKAAIIPAIEETINNADLPPGVTIELTGTIPYNKQFEDAGNVSAVILVISAFVLMFVVLRLLFSSMQHWYMPIILLFIGLTYCFGIMGILRVPMNDGATAAFPILLGLGIDYAVQFHSRFDEERRKLSVDDAIRETVMHTGPAVLLAMFATSMGFLAIFIVPVPMMKTFASVSLIGVGSCYLASLFGFHALVKITGYEPKPVQGVLTLMMKSYGDMLGRVVKRVTKKAVPFMIIALTIACAGVVVDHSIPIDTDT